MYLKLPEAILSGVTTYFNKRETIKQGHCHRKKCLACPNQFKKKGGVIDVRSSQADDGVKRGQINHDERICPETLFGAFYDIECERWRCCKCRLSLSNCVCLELVAQKDQLEDLGGNENERDSS